MAAVRGCALLLALLLLLPGGRRAGRAGAVRDEEEEEDEELRGGRDPCKAGMESGVRGGAGSRGVKGR